MLNEVALARAVFPCVVKDFFHCASLVPAGKDEALDAAFFIAVSDHLFVDGDEISEQFENALFGHEIIPDVIARVTAIVDGVSCAAV